MEKLVVGLLISKPGLDIILQQEGIANQAVDKISKDSLAEYPVVICNKPLDQREKNVIREFVTNGGSALLQPNCEFYPVKKKKVKCLVSEKKSPFSLVGLVDIYDYFYIPKMEIGQSLDNELKVFTNNLGEGRIICLPFNIEDLMLNYESRRKKFYDERKEFSSEIVAKISKAKIRRIIRIAIKELFFEQNLPLIQKWYYPKNFQNIFAFRVDTDFCSNENASKLYDVLEKNDIKATWFLDADLLKNNSKLFHKFKNQEISLHCFQHYVYDSYQKNFDNIRRGTKILQESGFHQTGFAAPFGDWNENLDKVLEELSFSYSSEFVPSYDDFPFHLYSLEKFSSVLQIPIHPISPGRLRRSHYSQSEMFSYYKNVVQQKIKTNLPIIFYHHPNHKLFNMMDRLFQYINSLDEIWQPTFSEFAQWWEERNNYNCEITYDRTNNSVKFSKTNSSGLVYRISLKNYGSALVEPEEKLDIRDLDFTKQSKYIPPDDIKRIRKWHWRDWLYNYESKKARRYYENNNS